MCGYPNTRFTQHHISVVPPEAATIPLTTKTLAFHPADNHGNICTETTKAQQFTSVPRMMKRDDNTTPIGQSIKKQQEKLIFTKHLNSLVALLQALARGQQK